LREGGCLEAEFCSETGLLSILVEPGLELSVVLKELSIFFLTTVANVGADLRDEGIVFAFR
jgi:hypothetical protein